jgi:uncharacterized membrane protein YphA (DoxX/SURF4 family)
MSAITAKAPVAARVLLGLPLVVFGLNGFLHFIPMDPMTGAAGAFMGGLAAAPYFFPLLKATEIATGLLLLSGRLVPLALVILAPILIQIFAFHAFLAGGVGLPLMLVALAGYLAYAYRDAYRGVLNPHARPAAGERRDLEPAASLS